MEELNVISDNGCGFVTRSAGRELTATERDEISAAAWVDAELEKTRDAALDPSYPLLGKVLEYRSALREYVDSGFTTNRPSLEV